MLPLPRYTQQAVVDLHDLIEAGRYRAVVDRRYPLEDAVEATRYVETEQKTGNVVLTVGLASVRPTGVVFAHLTRAGAQPDSDASGCSMPKDVAREILTPLHPPQAPVSAARR